MWRAQHIGHHVTAWQEAGHKEMPIAVAIGWEPSLDFVGGSPVPKGLCEYDVVGAIRGEPVELVKCETVDLYVPASAEIVIEGYLSSIPRPTRWKARMPSSPATSPATARRSHHPCHRHHPPHRSDPARHHRGLDAGQLFRERRVLVDHARGDRLERAGPRRRAGRHRRMVSAGAGRREYVVQIKQSYRGQAKQVANALWGSSAAHVRYKHVTVVDDDIDIHDYAAVDWAIAYRVNAGEDDIVIMPATFGAGSIRRRGGATATSSNSAPANGIAC